MKKKIFLLALIVCSLGSFAAYKAYWVYIQGPDSQCSLEGGSYGVWSIEETDPGATYLWYINDADARDNGYPAWSWGRPADSDQILEESISFDGSSGSLQEVMITCKITSNGQDYYEGFTVYRCE